MPLSLATCEYKATQRFAHDATPPEAHAVIAMLGLTRAFCETLILSILTGRSCRQAWGQGSNNVAFSPQTIGICPLNRESPLRPLSARSMPASHVLRYCQANPLMVECWVAQCFLNSFFYPSSSLEDGQAGDCPNLEATGLSTFARRRFQCRQDSDFGCDESVQRPERVTIRCCLCLVGS